MEKTSLCCFKSNFQVYSLLTLYFKYIFHGHKYFALTIRQLYMPNIAQEKGKNKTLLSRIMAGNHITDYKEIMGPSCDCINIKRSSDTDSWNLLSLYWSFVSWFLSSLAFENLRVGVSKNVPPSHLPMDRNDFGF